MRSPEVTSRIMKAIRGKDTEAELVFRRALFARDVRYRKHYDRIPGTPDVAIVWAKIAIFIDGDFWHGNSWRRRGLPNLAAMFPTRTEYWVKKIERNIARDKRVTRELIEQGWMVMRFWENEVLEDVDKCVDAVVARLSEYSSRR